MLHHRLSLSALALICAIHLPAQECPPIADDGFAVACCAQVAPSIPTLPSLTCPTDYAEYVNCTRGNSCTMDFTYGAPVRVACDRYTIGVTGTAGGLTVSGVLNAKYARTFLWINPANQASQESQVWRFVVNGDLQYSGSAPGCPIPPCTVVDYPVHVVGSVDYECHLYGEPPVAEWSLRSDLTHHDDQLHHQVSRQPVPPQAAYHPGTSYTFMCPAPITTAPLPYPASAFSEESMRESDLIAGLCFGEIGVVSGIINNVSTQCGSTTATRTHQSFSGTAVCGPNNFGFNTNPWNPTLPNGALATYLGTHSVGFAPGFFPDGVAVWNTIALHRHEWQCNSNNSGDGQLSHGVTTQILPPTGPGAVENQFVLFNGANALTLFDLGNHVMVSGATVAPSWGTPDTSDLVLNFAW